MDKIEEFVNGAVNLINQTISAQQMSIRELAQTLKIQTEIIRMLDDRLTALEKAQRRDK